MDGDRKKRKIDQEPAAAAEEEESEEEKMEKFFALIRSTREARDLLRGNVGLLPEFEKLREDRRKTEEDHRRLQESVWNPTFRPEDFSQDPFQQKFSATPDNPDAPSSSGHETHDAQPGPSKSKQDDEGKDDDDKNKREKEKDDSDGDGGDLNLKLSL